MSRDRLAAVDDDVESERRREADEESAQERDAARARSRSLLARQFPFAAGARSPDGEEEHEPQPKPDLDVLSLLSASKQAAPAKRVAQANANRRNQPNRDPGFEQVSRAGLREGHAPSKVVLPEAIDEGLDEAAARAEQGEDGEYREQGGNVVRNYNGSYTVRHGEEGNDDTFEASYNDVGWAQELVGVMHTHPTYKGDPASFSHADFSSLTAEGQPLNLLRSGDMTYMIARTREFDRLVATYEESGKLDELERKIYDCWENVYDKTKGKHGARVEAATLAVCKEFHLVYYKGEGRELKRVSPRPDDKEREP